MITQPAGLQNDLLKCRRETRQWILSLVHGANETRQACEDVLARLERFEMDYDSRQILKNALRAAGVK